jgi:AraC-like DNA-binding protein
MLMSGIFMSVPRALHFAYLIQAYEASPESILARILRAHMEECDVWEPRRARTVDFSGLNALETRAECANIRAAVARELKSKVEQAVIRARYGLTRFVDEDGERRFFFDKERVEAIQFLALKWAAPQMPGVQLEIIDLLIARHFCSDKATRITLRAIAERFGKSHTHYRRLSNRLEEQLIAIEARALDGLGEYFTREHHGHSIA